MLDKEIIKEKMKERGFIVYATIGKSKIQFVSEYMYDWKYEENTPPRQRKPVINVFVDLEKDEFQCAYNLSKSIDSLTSPSCGSAMNDNHFDNIVSRFESEAKWLSKLTE